MTAKTGTGKANGARGSFICFPNVHPSLHIHRDSSFPINLSRYPCVHIHKRQYRLGRGDLQSAKSTKSTFYI